MQASTRKYVAEMLGTFVLVLFGCGSAATVGPELGVLGVAFAFGLAVMGLVYVIGPISGCHVNPAVSLAMFLRGQLSMRDMVGYISSQILGALAGAGLLYAIIDSTGREVASLGQNGYGSGYGIGISPFMAFLVEIVLTFVFVYVLLGVTSSGSSAVVAGLVIGLTLALVHIFGIGLTGTSVNPARSLAPALILGGEALSQVWIFLVAPLLGAVLANSVFGVLNGRR